MSNHVTDPTGEVTIRYWAGARQAAGVDADAVPAGSLEEVLAACVGRRPALEPVVPVCSLLVDGVASDRQARVPAGTVVEVLPPFAGG